MALGKFETVKKRYQQGFVRDDQLQRYWELGVLTEDQYIEIYQLKYPGGYPEGLEPAESKGEDENV